MLKLPPLSLYIHLPWCIQKCPYCDFNSHQLRNKIPENAYVEHLLADLEQDLPSTSQRPLHTIFIGGGTPSLFSGKAITKLLEGIRQRIAIVPAAEITLEANPGAVDIDHFYDYQKAGVTRLSIGVQSFSDQQLEQLGRIHRQPQTLAAIKLAQQLALTSFNLDIMHGLPKQKCAEAISDLAQAVSQRPPHLSWYQLTIEPNTLFHKQPPILPDDDTLWEIEMAGKAYLADAGYQQYEISAYSLPGHQSEHNLNYWRFGDYLGIGCGAHGKLCFADGRIMRRVKVQHPRGYLGGRYLSKETWVPLAERPFEFFLNRFRLLEPTPRADFQALTGIEEKDIRQALDQALVQGFLEEHNTYWQVTPYGHRWLNSLIQYFMAPNM